MHKRNASIDREEKAKLKKRLLKEMQLLRLREPMMPKREYHERLKKIEDAPEINSSPSRNTPKAILRQLLFVTVQEPP